MSNFKVVPAPTYEKIFYGIGMQWQKTNNRGKDVLGGCVRQEHEDVSEYQFMPGLSQGNSILFPQVGAL